MELSVRLAGGPQSPRQARQVVDETFGRWGCADLTEDARVVVTELVTNAVLHARTDLELVLELRPSEVRVRVTDQGSAGRVAAHAAATGAETGRGLHLVEALADHWGVERRTGDFPRTTVWAAWDRAR